MKKSNQIKLLVAVAAGFVLLFFSFDVEAQCAMCKASIESSVEEGVPSPGSGINQGIMYIMGIPYLLVATAGFFIYRHNKNLDKA